MTHRRYERVFMRACEKLKLDPSRWIPHIKAEGVYEMGTAYDSADAMFGPDGKLGDGTPALVEFFSLYAVFEAICRERRGKRNGVDEQGWPTGKTGFWEEFWGFLAEVDLGVYDSTGWAESAEVIDENP